MIFPIFFSFTLLHTLCKATPTQGDGVSITVASLVKDTSSLENLAVRHNGDILVTSIDSSTIFQVSTTEKYPPIAVGQIPRLNATLGIVELESDVFYIAACNRSGVSGTNNEVWKLDMRPFKTGECGAVVQPAEVYRVATIPEAQLLNGMTRLAANDKRSVLAADSGAGKIYKVDVLTGTSQVVIQHPTMAASPGGLGIGVNGVHTFGHDLYYTSLDQGIFARVPLSISNGTAVGPVDIISNGTLSVADDFILSREGTKAWIAENGLNVLIEVDIASKQSRVIANSTLLGALSAVALGRSSTDRATLYTTGSWVKNGTNTWGQVNRVEFLSKRS